MITRFLAAAVVALALAGPAAAFQCPVDMAKIDAALAEAPDLGQEKLQQVKAWRAEGEKLHQSGDHAAAVETLAKAKEALGIEE